MKKIRILFLLVMFGLPALKAHGQASVRGQVVYFNTFSGQYIPLTGARVDLIQFNTSLNQWVIVATVFTDIYGFYYFFNIYSGAYTLQVNGQKNYPVSVGVPTPGYYWDIPQLIY